MEKVVVGVNGDQQQTQAGTSDSAPRVTFMADVQPGPSAPPDITTETRCDIPPNYASSSQNNLPPPPSYDSLFGKVKKIQNESMEKVSCGDKVYSKVCGFLMKFLGVVLFIGTPLSMLVMGVLYLDKCPHERMVTVYLVTAGSTTVGYFLLVMLRSAVKKLTKRRKKGSDDGEMAVAEVTAGDSEEKESSTCCDFCDGFISLFIISWFIAGNYYIYSTWTHRPCDYDCPSMVEYCDPVLLYFAFWLINSIYILCGCCTCLGMCAVTASVVSS